MERKQGPRGVAIDARARSACLTSSVRHQSALNARLARFAQWRGYLVTTMSCAALAAAVHYRWRLRAAVLRPLSGKGGARLRTRAESAGRGIFPCGLGWRGHGSSRS